MHSAYLLRVADRCSVVVLLKDTMAVIHAELETPMTTEEFTDAQSVHALSPAPTQVQLGPYDMERTRFTKCRISPLPVATHTRIDYSQRRKSN